MTEQYKEEAAWAVVLILQVSVEVIAWTPHDVPLEMIC